MSEHTFHGRKVVKPGAALKAFRAKKGWSLAELSRHTGLPISSLSKVENDKMDLTLDKLLRISVALETDIAGLFTPVESTLAAAGSGGRRAVTRAGEGELVDTPIGQYRYVAYDLINKRAIPIIMTVTARSLDEFGEFNRHPGEEFILVLQGELALYTDKYMPINLKKGDSLYFDSDMGHAYVCVGDSPCQILSVCVPPEGTTLKEIEHKLPRQSSVGKAAEAPAPARKAEAKRPRDARPKD